LVLQLAVQALKPIKASEEIFVTYGFNYWEMCGCGLFELPITTH
jgi:hypothetical protein